MLEKQTYMNRVVCETARSPKVGGNLFRDSGYGRGGIVLLGKAEGPLLSKRYLNKDLLVGAEASFWTETSHMM